MSDEPTTPVHPPVWLLWAAAVAIVAAAGLAVVGARLEDPAGAGLTAGDRLAHLAGYGLSALVAIGFVAAFPRLDAVRRRSRWYAPRRGLRKVAAALALAALGVAGLHAWPIAEWLARQVA